MVLVREEENEIIKINMKTDEKEIKPISIMQGYDVVEKYFVGTNEKKKGLEGITWNSKTGTIFVMKEAVPGLLMEVSSDLKTILDHKLLNEKNGFYDNNMDSDGIDFSGISYDASRNKFWIVSDKARRLYLYDWISDKVIKDVKLSFSINGVDEEIVKSEGVAIEPDSNRLYVVTDKDRDEKTTSRLYILEIHE